MSAKSICLTVRLDPETHTQLKKLVNETGVPISAVIREATVFYLKVLNERTEVQLRKRLMSEYAALAIDLIIATEYPADRDRLIAEAVRRAEGIDAFA